MIARILRLALHVLPVLLIALAPLALQGCMQEGTESGTETGFEGRLTQQDDRPAAGGEVYAFRTGGLDGHGTAREDSALLIRILENPDTLEDLARFRRTTAGADGRYRFLDLAPGFYAVIGFYEEALRRGKWVGFQPTLRVEAASVTEAGNLALQRIGGISASVTFKGAPAENVKCQIPGYSYVAYTDASGRCMLLNVQEGSHLVQFEHPGFETVKRADVPVVSGRITFLADTVVLVRDPKGAPPAPGHLSVTLDPATRIVTLAWDSVEVSDLAGYILYRKPVDSSTVEETALHGQLIKGRQYRDTLYKVLSDTDAATYRYRILAVDVDGVRSLPGVFPVLESPAVEPVRIAFSAAAYAAREGQPAAVAWLRRTGPGHKAVTVKWALLDSSAEKDSDYVALSGEVAFAPGDSLKPLQAPLVDDRHVEAPETFLARLLSADHGAVLASPREARLQVQDDDSLTRIRCPVPVVAATEKDSSAVVMLRREGDKARKATLHWRTRPGTAQEGADFPADSGTISFDSGAVSLRLPIRLVNDTLEEKPERFAVAFGRPSRDVDLAACPEIHIDVADDDTNYVAAPVDFTKAFTQHTAGRPNVSRFPGGLYDGDTLLPGLIENKATNPALMPKPVGHWDFKDCGQPVIPDLSGNRLDGNASTATLGCRSDSSGKWAQFSGEDSVVVPAQPALDLRQQVTLTAWAKPDSVWGRHTVAAKMYAPTAYALELVDNEWNWTINIEDGTWEGNSFLLKAPAVAGEWAHVAGVFDGNVQRLFVNGELVAEQQLKGRIQLTGRTFVIGNHPEWSPWHGGIREVKLFGEALTPYQLWEQINLTQWPPKPLTVIFNFSQPIRAIGAGVVVGGTAGSTKYQWSLAGADTQADLDAKAGSYAEIGGLDLQAADAWSRIAFRMRAFKIFRFTLTGRNGNGYLQVNELSLMGAERIKLP